MSTCTRRLEFARRDPAAATHRSFDVYHRAADDLTDRQHLAQLDSSQRGQFLSPGTGIGHCLLTSLALPLLIVGYGKADTPHLAGPVRPRVDLDKLNC
jgi:hypothetical protein